MRHRKAGRRLDRHSQERAALFRTLTMSLFERFGTTHEYVLTSIAKAKEARGFAERLICLGIKCRKELDAAAKAAGLPDAESLRKAHAEGKKKFKDYPEAVREHVRKSIHFRRLAIQRLGSTTTPTYRASEFDGKAPRHERNMDRLVYEIAPRYIKREQENPKAVGGYTRVLKTNAWVKGDGSTRALWGFVGGEHLLQAQMPSTRVAGGTPVKA